MDLPASDAYTCVVYVDLLGFSALTERNEIPHERLVEDMPRLFKTHTFGKMRRREPIGGQQPVPGGELAAVFWLFHHTVAEARTDFVVHDSPLTVLSFSDSVFLVTPSPSDALNLSLYLMRKYMERRLPVRIGVGHGSFAPLRYMLDWAARQHTFAAQFVGSGLVRAYGAAECKTKGLRIFISPSMEQTFSPTHMARFHRLPLAENERGENATFELNYLSGDDTVDADISKAVLEMQATAPASALKHYEATLEALKRMAVSLSSSQPTEN